MKYLLMLPALLVAQPASATLAYVSANTFVSHHIIEVALPPEQAYRGFADIRAWWDPDHTYSGDLKRVRLKLKPGGCFCETLPDGGGVEHMRVTFVDPGKRIVMTGALGPLLYQGVAGVMDVQFQKTHMGTVITLDYRVAGFAMNNGELNAPLVDRVLTEQVGRLKKMLRAQEPTVPK